MPDKIKTILKYIVIFILLLVICILFNRALVIKGLYKDDLYNWSWFPGMNIWDFSFGFYSDTRYRPFFNILQYLQYMIVANSPIRFTYVNYILNTFIALFVYHFAKRLKANGIISFLVAGLYLSSHFAYYQIGQAFGLLETEAQFFALLILFLCLKLTNIIEKKSLVITTITIFIVFFVVAFTHERYLCLAPVILISLIFAKGYKKIENVKRNKIINVGILIMILLIIAYIRYIAVGKVLPAGTGGTYVEETFNFMDSMKNCFTQLAFIFGINIGPEHLVGIEFFSLQNRLVKYFAIASICFVVLIFVIYFVTKMHHKNEYGKGENYLADILFAFFIIMCIGATSVTIRIEMRFIYTSFTACLLYLSYASGYISDKKGGILSFFLTIIALLFFITRVPLEMKYRSYFPKVHCIIDQMMMNSLYDNTIGVYGVDDILHNKQVYILYNNFGMTDFYAKTYYQIFDKNNVGKEILFINDLSELPENANDDNSIVLMENLVNNAYVRQYIN